MSKPPGYTDLADMPESDRIEAIGSAAMRGLTVAFITEDTPGKAARYIKKLHARFPRVVVLDQTSGPVKGTITVRVVGPKH